MVYARVYGSSVREEAELRAKEPPYRRDYDYVVVNVYQSPKFEEWYDNRINQGEYIKVFAVGENKKKEIGTKTVGGLYISIGWNQEVVVELDDLYLLKLKKEGYEKIVVEKKPAWKHEWYPIYDIGIDEIPEKWKHVRTEKVVWGIAKQRYGNIVLELPEESEE